MSETPPLRPGSVIASRYELGELLGRGGMGIVFKAHDRLLDETVAMKFLNEDVSVTSAVAQRFRAEIKLARKVTHRGVCRIHEYGEDSGLRYISMAFVDGVDLKRLMQKKGPLPPDEAIQVAISIAEALQAIHEEGVIHRDLKTSNIMIDGKGAVRLMDFGLAKEWTAEPGSTASGQIIGTPDYMSPEQAQGLKADHRSDVYSLGVVMFEIFTGALPFEASTPVAALVKHIHDEPPLDGPQAAAVPRQFVPILKKALAKDPAQRFQAASEIAAALNYARYPRDSASASLLERLPRDKTEYEWTDAAGKPARFKDARPQTLPPRASTGRLLIWLTAAFGIIAVASLGIAWNAYRQARSRDVEPPTREPESKASIPTAAETERAEPSDLPLPEADKPARELPSAPSTMPAIRRQPRPASQPPSTSPPPEIGPAPTPTALAAETPAPTPVMPQPTPPASATAGTLQLLIIPTAEVLIDGGSLGSVSTRELNLEPGAHVVRILHPDYQPLQRMVTIRSGETTRLVLDLTEKGIRRR